MKVFITFNVLPSPIPTLFHSNFPLLECQSSLLVFISSLFLNRFPLMQTSSLEIKRHNMRKSCEYGRCSYMGFFRFAKNYLTERMLCASAYGEVSIRHSFMIQVHSQRLSNLLIVEQINDQVYRCPILQTLSMLHLFLICKYGCDLRLSRLSLTFPLQSF